jgi:hypothetical protein
VRKQVRSGEDDGCVFIEKESAENHEEENKKVAEEIIEDVKEED